MSGYSEPLALHLRMTKLRKISPALPVPPFPTVGEIVYEVATRSGLVRTSNDKDPLYNALKAFKDDRKRPGLLPIEFPKTVLVDFEDRLAAFWNVEEEGNPGLNAYMTLGGIRQWLDSYAGFVAACDATLIEREQMVELVLWPTLFSTGGAFLLRVFVRWKPYIAPIHLLEADNPFGLYVRFLCKNGAADYKAICDYRATHQQGGPIDRENCRKTLDQWLCGKAVPSLARCQEILVALGLAENLAAKIWMLTARLLQKTPKRYRLLILDRLKDDTPAEAQAEAHRLIKDLAWKLGASLQIGPDRPYVKIRTALYQTDPVLPRVRADIVDMLRRQEKTWEPIADQTQHMIHWLWGRFHVLCGEYRAGLDRYKLAYDYGANRDPEIYHVALHEARILAAFLGEKRQAERFKGWAGLYSYLNADEENEPIVERFDKTFPPALRFPMETAGLPTTEVQRLLAAAEAGDALAQNELGLRFQLGNGVAQDLAAAAAWYRKSAEQGMAIPQYNLALLYREGFGVEQSYENAFYWLIKAAQQGLANAQYDLGLMREYGHGTAKDDGDAIRWLTCAAEQGMPEAQNHLGVRYSEGRGVPRSDVQALQWSKRAAEQGLSEAQHNLALFYLDGVGVRQDDERAVFWTNEAAQQGHEGAIFNLGQLYLKGRGVQQDTLRAIACFRLLAEKGNVVCQYNLGVLYGQAAAWKDEAESVVWYEKAAMQGYADAQANLALLYIKGEGVLQDYNLATEYLLQAAAQGHAGAQHNLRRLAQKA